MFAVVLAHQPVAQGLGVGDDHRERRAQLVADVGQKLGLHLVDFAQALVGVLEILVLEDDLLLEHLALRDVVHEHLDEGVAS